MLLLKFVISDGLYAGAWREGGVDDQVSGWVGC